MNYDKPFHRLLLCCAPRRLELIQQLAEVLKAELRRQAVQRHGLEVLWPSSITSFSARGILDMTPLFVLLACLVGALASDCPTFDISTVWP